MFYTPKEPYLVEGSLLEIYLNKNDQPRSYYEDRELLKKDDLSKLSCIKYAYESNIDNKADKSTIGAEPWMLTNLNLESWFLKVIDK